jgi:hypothetical protein
MDIKRFYVTEQIGKNQAKTPEGFLVCANTAIARTGEMVYGPGETDLAVGPDGIVKISRDEDEVFSQETIASFEGKPVVIDHPEGDVTPSNWRELAVGVCTNVRRGSGIENHLLLADLLITRQDAIDLLARNPVYEVSCGYDARYAAEGLGRGKQVAIRGNHIALVENGRCGPICATKDHLSPNLAPCLKNAGTLRSAAGESVYSLPRKTGDQMANRMKDWLGKMKDALMSGDLEAAKSTMDEGASVMQMTGNPDDNETHTHVHIHAGPPAITEAAGGLPNTGETRVSSASDDASAGNGPTFGGRTFFSDEAIEERFKKTDDSFEEFKKECRDSFQSIKDSMAEMAKSAGMMMGGTNDEAGEAPGGEPDKEIEGELKEEAPPGTGESIMKAKDSAMLEDSFSQTLAMAEILVPGIAVPTFDRAAGKADTYKSICALRRNAVRGVAMTRDGAALIQRVAGKTIDVDSIPCRDLAPIFRGAAAAKAEQNNAAATKVSTRDDGFFGVKRTAAPAAPKTLAEINALYAKHWEAQGVAK